MWFNLAWQQDKVKSFQVFEQNNHENMLGIIKADKRDIKITRQ